MANVPKMRFLSDCFGGEETGGNSYWVPIAPCLFEVGSTFEVPVGVRLYGNTRQARWFLVQKTKDGRWMRGALAQCGIAFPSAEAAARYWGAHCGLRSMLSYRLRDVATHPLSLSEVETGVQFYLKSKTGEKP